MIYLTYWLYRPAFIWGAVFGIRKSTNDSVRRYSSVEILTYDDADYMMLGYARLSFIGIGI